MYNFKSIENKWQEYWDKNGCFKTDVWDFSKPKYYVLDMFPYPSGVGLHAGHPEGYTATDIIARMKRMQGYNVLHPMGFDAFGLPAEQFAIQTGNNPSGFTEKNIETFKGQLRNIGLSYDWDREVSTADPEFYKWTQWIFKQLVVDNIAKKIDMPVNWCPELGTVLANDEVIDGKSERGGYPVVRRNMRQWVIDIPKYAERLLEGLDSLDWPNSTKESQRNWIGKSVGAHVSFKVFGVDETFTVFTTRCDTLFGATYCVLSPEHPLIDMITTSDKRDEVNEYKRVCASKSELERTELNKDKTGVFTGAYAVNPVNGENIPIWISDYVLMTYGTGAIMAVPAHDDRDYAFARKYNIPIIQVLDGGDISDSAYTGDGNHINSSFLDGLNKSDAIKKMLEWLVSNNVGYEKVNYKIREWIFARQRYWGEPIPTIELENGEMVVLRDEELPLILPVLDNYSPLSDGQAPLCRDTDWVNVEVNGIKGKRETSTMPGSAGSSWYYLRYIDPNNDNKFADKKLLEHWLPVDLYMGGHEHVVGHLLYARMWNNYLYDKGLVPVKEPFKKLVHQGMILGENGIKMGKRYPEFAINPNDIVDQYGADTLRLYEMFMGPIESDKPWSTQGVNGAHKFLERVWRLIVENGVVKDIDNANLDKSYNVMIKKVTDDYNNLNFNTAISQMMIFVNDCYKESVVPIKYAVGFVKMLYPVCPHISEEMYELLGESGGLTYSSWPTYDEAFIQEDTVDIAVQVNGKMRGTITINDSMSEDQVKDLAINNSNVLNYTVDKEIVRIIVVKGKIVNIVVK